MAYLITEECISCAACIHECPNEAIFENDELHYEIDPNKCTECEGIFEEPQCISVCPVEGALLKTEIVLN
ncbi:MAG: 4Fe-4S binding protein [Ignavibacteriae bacterium]|jgi:ferredoxin|nr:4Fe-4S dicluster domain-containing protein [Ignavibacteriota bacterium]NOG98640.1 4Fe-4S binding protein [Ignavibacteriota bacterium]